MRKNYFLTLLLTLCISAASFGQVILAEGFDYADGPLVPNGGWTSAGGAAGTFLVSSGQAVVQHGTPDEDVRYSFTPVSGDIFVAFDFSVDDLGAPYGAGSDFEYFAHFRFRSQIDVVPPTGSGDYTLGISSDDNDAEAVWATDLTFGTTYRAVMRFNQDTGTATLWIDPTADTDTSISGTDDGAFSVTSFDLRQSDSEENETVRVDNLMIGQTFNDVLVFAPQTDPTLSITGITDNQEFHPWTTEVAVGFSISNFTLSGDNGSGMSDGTGDGYIVGTAVENGGTPDSDNIFGMSVNYEGLQPGDNVMLTAELVDNAGNSLTPPVVATVNFTIAAAASQASDIATLRAGTEGDYYELTGESTLTWDAMNGRNQKYIQDGSAAILIDDDAGTITTSYNVGDGITGIRGRLGSFNGVLQFVPSVDPGAATATGLSITPQVVTIADLNSNLDDYESELVTINDVNFVDADGSTSFGNGNGNYDITDGTNTLIFRLNFTTDINGTLIPSSSANITGIPAEFGGDSQIFGLSLSNIVLGVQRDEIEGFAAFPNPVRGNGLTVRTGSIDTKEVALFNVLGRKVFAQSFSGTEDTFDVSNLSSGIYILKVTEGSRIATQKVVIE